MYYIYRFYSGSIQICCVPGPPYVSGKFVLDKINTKCLVLNIICMTYVNCPPEGGRAAEMCKTIFTGSRKVLGM